MAPSPDEVEKVEGEKPTPPATNQDLAALEKVTGNTGKLWSDVRDVRAMLKAEAKEAAGDYSGAAALWFDALGSAQGKFGHKALYGWLKAYARALGKKSDKAVLARLIMAETQDGQKSPYMRAKGLTSDAAMFPVLKAAVPAWLTPDEPAVAGAEPTATEPPATEGLPPEDPLLVKAAPRSCGSHAAALSDWKRWLDSLPEDVGLYWQALVEQHCGRAANAIAKFKAVYPELARQKATQAMAVEAAGRVAALDRANDRRTDAAATYTDLVDLWDKPGVTAEAMGLEPMPFALRRIDETLWASRYRALVGDYENGKIYAQAALALVSNAYALRPQPKKAQKEQLASLRAEAYHALAFRIALEKKEFESALSLDLLALDSPDLTREWQEKLTWFAGVYDYLAGRPESAKKRWVALLAKTKDDSLRSAAYFWTAKALEKLGRQSEAQAYVKRLTEEYSLSYYSVVAPTEAGLEGGTDWRQIFGSPVKLAKSIEKHRDFGLAKLRKSGKIGPLLSRAEILVTAGLGDLARLAVDELEAAMGAELKPETNASAYVYLTRLQYRSGSYLKAIGLTTRLTKAVPGFWQAWPEQILIYFPRPYHDDYERSAQEESLDKELLLAISRQESGFTPEIRSSVNAVGIMQLIHPTGHKYAAELGLPTDDIDATLRNPTANIRIGSRYLKVLTMTFKGFPPAVYGGYNAGEYTVDLWLQRRAHSDPLMFVELVPFGETKDYIRNVWRNVLVYRHLEGAKVPVVTPALELIPVNEQVKPEPGDDRPAADREPHI